MARLFCRRSLLSFALSTILTLKYFCLSSPPFSQSRLLGPLQPHPLWHSKHTTKMPTIQSWVFFGISCRFFSAPAWPSFLFFHFFWHLCWGGNMRAPQWQLLICAGVRVWVVGGWSLMCEWVGEALVLAGVALPQLTCNFNIKSNECCPRPSRHFVFCQWHTEKILNKSVTNI